MSCLSGSARPTPASQVSMPRQAATTASCSTCRRVGREDGRAASGRFDPSPLSSAGHRTVMPCALCPVLFIRLRAAASTFAWQHLQIVRSWRMRRKWHPTRRRRPDAPHGYHGHQSPRRAQDGVPAQSQCCHCRRDQADDGEFIASPWSSDRLDHGDAHREGAATTDKYRRCPGDRARTHART